MSTPKERTKLEKEQYFSWGAGSIKIVSTREARKFLIPNKATDVIDEEDGDGEDTEDKGEE